MSRSLQWHWFCLVVFMQVIYQFCLNMHIVCLEIDDVGTDPAFINSVCP